MKIDLKVIFSISVNLKIWKFARKIGSINKTKKKCWIKKNSMETIF